MPHSDTVVLFFEPDQESFDRMRAAVQRLHEDLSRLEQLQERVLANAEKLRQLGGFGGFRDD